MQNKTKGRLIIAMFVLVSGIIGGILAALVGDTPASTLLFALLFGAAAYTVLVLIGFTVLYAALRSIQEANSDK